MAKVPYSVPGDRRFDWWWAQQRRKYRREGPVSPFLLFDYPGAAAAYSLRDLNGTDPLVVRVRRSLDNAEQNFSASAIEDGTLEAFVNATDTKPADYGTGAAAAYSLRVVSDSYTGPVVRVRESVGNTEQDFTADEITDGTLVAFVGAGNDGFVTTWYDQSENSNDATQATASKQPKIVDNGSLVTENGKAAVDCGLQSEDRYLERSYSSLSYQSFSAFVIGSTNGFSNVGSTILGFNTNPRFYFPLTRSTGLWVSYEDLEAIQVSANSTEPQFVISGFANDSTFECFFNSQNKGSVASISGSSSYISVGYNGGTAYHNGKIQEIIIYPSDQSANRAAIEGNINGYYGIYSQTTDGFVTTWYDQSGNGNDATQATAASQPKIVSAGALVTDASSKVIDFTGAKSLISAPISGYTSSSPDSCFVVGKIGNITSGRVLVAFEPDFTAAGFVNELSSFNYRSGTFSGDSGTTRRIYSGIYDGSEAKTYFNGVLNSTNPSADSSAFQVVAIGNITTFGRPGDPVISEIVYYPTDQSSNREAIETNINQHYGIF